MVRCLHDRAAMRYRFQTLGIVLGATAMCAGRAWGQNVTELYVSPDTVRIEPGQRLGLTVQAFDDLGNVVPTIRYRVSDSSVAQVTSNGTLTAGQTGTAQIVVQAGRKTRIVAVFVASSRPTPSLATRSGARAAAEIGQLTAEPASLTLLPAENARVALKAFYADGTPAPAVRVRWRSLSGAVASVEDSSGVITGVAAGQTIVQAQVPGGPTLSVPVRVSLGAITVARDRIVLSPEESDTLAVVVPAQGDRRIRSVDLQWSVSDEGVAVVSSDGVVRALSAGRAELIVRGFLQELRIPILVHQRIARFAVAPRLTEPVRLPVRATREFTVLPQTADSLPIDGPIIAWSIADTSIATFDTTTGRITARRPGTTTLQFAARGFLPKGWTIEVIPGTVSLGRPRFALRSGEKAALKPSYVDSAGVPLLPANGLSWVTSNANVARVKPDGTVEAVAPGRAVITAQTPGGEPASATVFVTGDLLLASTRGGRFGIYSILASQPESFYPLIADSSANNIDASYSPDRTRVVFSSDRFGAGNYDIFVAEADGRDPVRLTTEPGLDISPIWTPDGAHIVFVSTRSGTRQIYAMRADGRDVRQLTSLPGGGEEPAVSPDGKSVAFTGYPAGRDGQSDIYVVGIDGGTPRAVTSTSDRREIRPSYLPNGDLTWVAVRSDKREPDQLLRLPATGGNPVALVTTDLTISDYAVAPDGSRLVWVSSQPVERGRTGLEFGLEWRVLGSATGTGVRLVPGERITSPAF